MEETKCLKCGQALRTLHWSGKKEILICNNGKCLAYRNPVSNPAKEPEYVGPGQMAFRQADNPNPVLSDIAG